MKKRGQITLIIIIAISIFIIMGLYYYLNNHNAKVNQAKTIKKISEPADSEIVKAYAESCLKLAGENGLFEKIGLQGGFISPNADGVPSDKLANYNGNIVPYYLERQCTGTICTYIENFPESININGKLAKYIESEFEKCFNEKVFGGIGLNVTKPAEKAKVEVSFNKEDTAISLIYSLIAKRNGVVTKMDSFEVTVPIRLKALNESAKILMDKIKNSGTNPYNINANPNDCNSFFDKNGFTNVYVKTADSSTKIIQFIDYSTFNEHYFKSFIFEFAVKNIDVQGSCVG